MEFWNKGRPFEEGVGGATEVEADLGEGHRQPLQQLFQGPGKVREPSSGREGQGWWRKAGDKKGELGHTGKDS